MSDYITPQKAQETLLCPLSRAFGAEPLSANCRGPECACWRTKPLFDTDPGFKEAIAEAKKMTAAERDGETSQMFVSKNRAEFGLPTEPFLGFCGMGGRPIA